MDQPYVSVIGASEATRSEREYANEVGRRLAERGYRLVCGGLGGVMTAACTGHAEAGGRPIGILPGRDASEGNPHLDTVIVTGLGNMRNVLVVENGEAVIAIGGHFGTLSEIALALDAGIPVVGLNTHPVDGVATAETPAAAVDAIATALDC